MIRSFALGLLVVCCCLSADGAGTKKPTLRDHKKSIDNFRELVKTGFRGEYRDIEAKFNDCFQVNDLVSKFGNLFESATRYEKRKHKELGVLVRYTWEIKRKDESTWLEVYIGLDPPTVVMTQVKTIW